jgi:hypothetical protein
LAEWLCGPGASIPAATAADQRWTRMAEGGAVTEPRVTRAPGGKDRSVRMQPRRPLVRTRMKSTSSTPSGGPALPQPVQQGRVGTRSDGRADPLRDVYHRSYPFTASAQPRARAPRSDW